MIIAHIKQTTENLSFGKGDQIVNKIRKQILDCDQQDDWSWQTRHSSNQVSARDDCKGLGFILGEGNTPFPKGMYRFGVLILNTRKRNICQHSQRENSQRKLSENYSGKTSGKPMSWFLKLKVRQLLECSLADNFCKRSPERDAVFLVSMRLQ